jgi:hypothetical protein
MVRRDRVQETIGMTEDLDASFYENGNYSLRLEAAADFRGVWEIVQASVKDVLHRYRAGILLFLDDLPLRLGAYHQVGTNNIVLNRALLDLVEDATRDAATVNAFVYSLLLHEYLHAIGYLRETDVKPLALEVSLECFGPDHAVTRLAHEGPWSLLRDLPLDAVPSRRRVIAIVKDLEDTTRQYIV